MFPDSERMLEDDEEQDQVAQSAYATPRPRRSRRRRGSDNLAQLLFDSELRLNSFREALLDAVRDMSSSLDIDCDPRKLAAQEDDQLVVQFKSLLNIHGIPKPSETNMKSADELISAIEAHIDALNNAVLNVSLMSEVSEDLEVRKSCESETSELLDARQCLIDTSQKISEMEKDFTVLLAERDHLLAKIGSKDSEIGELEFNNSVLHESISNMQNLLDRAVVEIETLRADAETFPAATIASADSFDDISSRCLEVETRTLREKVKVCTYSLFHSANKNLVIMIFFLNY